MNFLKKLLEYEHYIALLIIPVFWLALISATSHDASYWLQYWWMFLVAILIAVTVNTVGISGAALFVPFFVIIFPLVAFTLLPEQSVKLGLITESFGLSSSALAFLRYGLVDIKLGMRTVLFAIPFVIGGAFLSFYIPKFMFHFFIAVMLLLSVYLILHKAREKSKTEGIKQEVIGKHHKEHADNATLIDKAGKRYKYCRQCGHRNRVLGYGLGGLFQGVTGFGIGELGIISMILTKIPIRVAIGTSHVIVALTAVTASIVHLIQSDIHNITTPWNILFMTVPAVILGGQIAPYVAAKLKSSVLERFVAGLFIILAMALLYLGISGI